MTNYIIIKMTKYIIIKMTKYNSIKITKYISLNQSIINIYRSFIKQRKKRIVFFQMSNQREETKNWIMTLLMEKEYCFVK